MEDRAQSLTEDAGYARFATLRTLLNGKIVGQEDAVETILCALLCDGHVLLEGPPGLAKTRLAQLLARALEGDYRRIQFTPDLLPGDLTGAPVFDPKRLTFEFRKGPIFCNVLLADEINRAPARVQSALLEAMEERQVTSGEESFPLDPPFFTIATQNPIEHDGTWELPQAQLDRFTAHVELSYPGLEDERRIFDLAMEEARESARRRPAPPPAAPIAKEELALAREAVADIHLSGLVRDYIARIVTATRDDPDPVPEVGENLAHAISPRGAISIGRMAQARAWLAGRDHVLPEDVRAVAPAALRHRVSVTYRAAARGVTRREIVQTLLEAVHAP